MSDAPASAVSDESLAAFDRHLAELSAAPYAVRVGLVDRVLKAATPLLDSDDGVAALAERAPATKRPGSSARSCAPPASPARSTPPSSTTSARTARPSSSPFASTRTGRPSSASTSSS